MLLWDLPVSLIGILLGSLLVSLLIEYACIAILWPDEGASHSYRVMVAESHWLSEGYTRSLLMAAPVETISRWVHTAWNWLFVDSGFSHWLQSFRETGQKGTGVIPTINRFGDSLIGWLGEYLQATLWVTLIFFIRVMILFLSLPLFGLVIITGIVEGLVRRDLRRYTELDMNRALSTITPNVLLNPHFTVPACCIWPGRLLSGQISCCCHQHYYLAVFWPSSRRPLKNTYSPGSSCFGNSPEPARCRGLFF